MPYPAWVLALGLAAATTFAVAVATWWRRPVPGGTAFALLMLAVTEWTLTRALEGAAADVPTKLMWAKLEYLGIASVAPLWLTFALGYTRQGPVLTPRGVALLWSLPAAVVALALTNDGHRLIWTRVVAGTGEPGILAYDHGAAFWIAVAYSYVLLLAATIVLVHAVARFPESYRHQTAALLIGAALPWGANLVYLLGRSPVVGLDLTPFAFAVSGVVIGVALLRYRLFDLIPVAREILVERMSDGVIVVDARGRVVDINPAAEEVLALPRGQAVGRPGLELLAPWTALAEGLRGPGEAEGELALGAAGACRYVHFRVSPLPEPRSGERGRLVELHDVTAPRNAEHEVQAANARLRLQIAEVEALQHRLSEQATRDWLTGLFNRRFFEDTLDRELSRAVREQRPLALVLIDVDHLKETNDERGHRAGDLVLRGIGELLASRTRRGDLACRFGGDEFVVIMPGAPSAAAARRAEQWRMATADLELTSGEHVLRGSISVGVAAYPEHGHTADEILRHADRALYAAKAAGRNTVRVAGSHEP